MSCEVLVQGRNWDWRNKEAGPKNLAAYQCNCIYNILIHEAQSILKSEEASASSAS